MTEKSSFFNSVAGDRKYQAADFANYFNSLITNGVLSYPPTNLQVVANNNMTITVKPGKAFINGYLYTLDSNLTFTLATADGTLNRWDRVVIRFSAAGRAINIAVKQGDVASGPYAPSLQRDSDCFELGICDIYISKGNLTIKQANMKDLRLNSSLCGWVNSLVQVDGETLYAQLTDSFNSWFTDVKSQLSSDVAGNLQNEINIIHGTGWTTQSIMSVLNALNALIADPTFSKPIVAPSITASSGFHGLGRTFATHWNGTIPVGKSITINHNLGYNPMIFFDGTQGNCLLNYNYTEGNVNQLTVFNAGTTNWVGNANMY